MNTPNQEEQLVAELDLLGIRYLSRQTLYRAKRVRSGKRLLVDLVRQPSSRVRTAIIAVFLAHPDYAQVLPMAIRQMDANNQLLLKLFYTAAVLLQTRYAPLLKPFMTSRWQWLPDLYSDELGLPAGKDPDDLLVMLGKIHQQKMGRQLNWTGTYDNTVQHLLRRWELEEQWNG